MKKFQLLMSRRWRRALTAPIAGSLLFALALVGYSSTGDAGAAGIAHSKSAAAAVAASTKSGCPTGTAPGATTSKVNVAITVVDISGGSLTNATVGVPSNEVQEKYWTLVANSINKSGGAGCRKLALSFYDVNPLDSSGAEQTCLQIAASHPFIVLDTGALSDIGASDCIPNAKIPFASTYLTPDELSKYYPYYLSVTDVPTDTIRTSVLGLAKLGFYSSAKGFKKLGLLYLTCNPTYYTAERAALKQAGVPKSKIVAFNLGCPAGQTVTSAAIQQAVLQFKSAGVTNVTDLEIGNVLAVFTQSAASQDYTPKYTLNNSPVLVANYSGTDAPNFANLNGAVDVVTQAYGEQTTPGYKPTAGTKKCNAIFTAAGQPTLYKQLDGYGGTACDYLWFVQGLLNHATSLQAKKLASAEHAIGSIDFSYPYAPVNYSAAPKGAVYGVSYWRAADFVSSCKCWHIPNPTWNTPLK